MSELWDIEAELAYRREQTAADLRTARARTRGGAGATKGRRGRTSGTAGTTRVAHRSSGAAARGWWLRGSEAWSAAR